MKWISSSVFIIWLMLAGMYAHSPVKPTSLWKAATLRYLNESLAKAEGGFGWADQHDAHLTPTFAAIGIMYDLDALPASGERLVEFVRTHHPQKGKNKEAGPSGTELRDLVYQQLQSIAWLKGDMSSFKNEVEGWKPQNNKVSNFENHGYPVFHQEMMTPVCRSMLGLSMAEVSNHYNGYIQSRRRSNGSFNNTPATDGGDGNIINTYWGLYGMRALNIKDEQVQQTSAWLNSCALASGGYTHQPKAELGAVDDVAYTWAAIKALKLLSAEPGNKAQCIRYLVSLRNDDGGFGKRPGQPSTPMASFYAIDALKTLNALASLSTATVKNKPVNKATDFSNLRIYTVQFEASGTGSPAEAVMLADSMQIHLWGAKNSTAAWRAAAQKIADNNKVAVTFFQSDEANNKTVSVPGQGTFTHILDFIAPPSANRNLNFDGSSWKAYTNTFVAPLAKDNGTLLLQVTNNEPLGRMLLDESIKNSGYSAISTIHFSQNFLFWLPWLSEYRHELPMIALQDAHGTESWWWKNELAAYRTLFLGKTGSYDDLMLALKNNWVVAVRHDSVSDFKTRMLGGANGVQSMMLKQQEKWKWWKDGSGELNQPLAAITVLTSKDSFEVAHPDAGVNVRIRCWWNSIRQALKNPLVELTSLAVDDIEVKPVYTERKDNKGVISDSYYLYPVGEKLANGRHAIKGTFKKLDDNTVYTVYKYFTYNNGIVESNDPGVIRDPQKSITKGTKNQEGH